MASGAVTRATLWDYLGRRRRFVEAFPYLSDWINAPLHQRLGYVADDSGNWRTTTRTKEGRLHYLARPYLYFLVLRGCLRFDLEWLVTARHIRLTSYLKPPELEITIQTLAEEATDLGYGSCGAAGAVTWVLPRLYLHTGKSEVGSFDEFDIEALKDAMYSLGSRPDLEALYGSRESYHTALKTHLSQICQVSVSLYHRGQFDLLPRKNITRRSDRPVIRPLMEATAERYARERSKDFRPSTAKGYERELKGFIAWVATSHPEVESFASVDREMVLEYAEAMEEMILPRTGRTPAPSTQSHRLQPSPSSSWTPQTGAGKTYRAYPCSPQAIILRRSIACHATYPKTSWRRLWRRSAS